MKNPTLTECPEVLRPHVDRVLAGEYDLPKNLRWKEGAISQVLDIGANVGAFTLWALAKWPACEVTAYEPLPENCAAIRTNVRVQSDRHWFIDRAVAGHCGPGLFFPGKANSGEGSLCDIGEQDVENAITVQVTDAKDLECHDFVKIDAEGSETIILGRMDLSGVRGLAVEWHSATIRTWIARHMRGQGFDLVKDEPIHATRGTQVWVRREWVEDATVAASGGKKIFLAMPVYGGYDPHFINSLMALIIAKPFTMALHPVIGDSLVARARNRAAATFLASDCTHLLFLDTDLIFSPEHIARLVSHDEPVVAGRYPKKQVELAWVCNLLPDQEMDERGLKPVRYAGTGCLLIERRILEAMRERWPELEYDPDDGDDPGVKWDFFSCGVYKCPDSGLRRYLSEDWWFCQRVLELGEKVWMDTQVICKHVGQMVYPLDTIESFADPAPTE